MPRNHLLNIIRDMYPPDIQRAVLPLKTAHAAHIVPVIRKLVPPKTIHVARKYIRDGGQAVQVLAVHALGT
jgi:hypothetical protein